MTKASDMLKVVGDFFTEEKLEQTWKCLHRWAPTMLGVRSDFLTLVIQKNPKVIGTHRIIHREALAAKTMS